MLMAFGASPAFTAGIGVNILNLLVIGARLLGDSAYD
jgi:hypothetical protein